MLRVEKILQGSKYIFFEHILYKRIQSQEVFDLLLPGLLTAHYWELATWNTLARVARQLVDKMNIVSYLLEDLCLTLFTMGVLPTYLPLIFYGDSANKCCKLMQ